MSPRAAWRLEALGFEEVYDYVAGKTDWAAFGLPVETNDESVGDRMLKEFPTCRPGEPVSEARRRARRAGLPVCPVVNETGIVLGLVAVEGGNADNSAVEGRMELGPTTLRPSASIEAAAELAQKAETHTALITSSDGKLMGIFRGESAGGSHSG